MLLDQAIVARRARPANCRRRRSPWPAGGPCST